MNRTTIFILKCRFLQPSEPIEGPSLDIGVKADLDSASCSDSCSDINSERDSVYSDEEPEPPDQHEDISKPPLSFIVTADTVQISKEAVPPDENPSSRMPLRKSKQLKQVRFKSMPNTSYRHVKQPSD